MATAAYNAARRAKRAKDAKRRDALKAKEAERLRMIRGGIALGYADSRIAKALGITVERLNANYADVIREGRDGVAMSVTGSIIKSAEEGDVKAAAVIMQVLERDQFAPKQAPPALAPVVMNLSFDSSHAPQTINVTPPGPQVAASLSFDGKPG